MIKSWKIGETISSLFADPDCQFRIRGERISRLHLTYLNPPISDLGRVATHLFISAYLSRNLKLEGRITVNNLVNHAQPFKQTYHRF